MANQETVQEICDRLGKYAAHARTLPPVIVTQESDPYICGPAYGAVIIGEPALDGDVLLLSGPIELKTFIV